MTEEIKEYKKEGFFPNIDSYWQKRWESCSLISGKKDKKYILEMFPYPSGKIHMGHVRNYVLGDVLCRYFVKKGYDILHTMAWDAFGLPAENAARKNNINPADWTHNNISNMRKELQSIGLLYNWKDEFATCDKEYYSHQQKIFLDLYNNGLVYKKNVWVNWDPIDKTVLANEQVIDGKGWRSGAQVERKKLSQWMLKITDFADDLIEGLDDLDWNQEVLQMQRNWIGRSEGFKISFKVNNSSDFKEIEVYTTRPETIFGASCLLLSPDHYISDLLSTNNFPLSNFINDCQKDNNSRDPNVPKKGIFIDIEVVNPATGDLLPVFIANFVLNHVTGAIFCCPAHDVRDFEFSKKYNLPINQVITPNDDSPVDLENEPYISDGKLINSGILDGLSVLEAREKFKNHNFVNQLASDGKIEVCFAYKLHDWCISRQRYWGCPIPIIDCKKCGLIPAKIPVILPEDVDINFQGNPLDSCLGWKNVECHNCGSSAARETDTMDTFVDSSWYFIRICSAKNSNIPFSQDDINKWMPVDYYIGGIEHAILHLLYSRFICRALNKCGYNIPKEPFKKLFAQGMVCHKTFKNKDTGDWVYPSDICFDDGKYRIKIPESYSSSVEGSEVIVGPSEDWLLLQQGQHHQLVPEQEQQLVPVPEQEQQLVPVPEEQVLKSKHKSNHILHQ
ncbi:leucine--tRNA ligase-like [Triplophysa rosa]|uniref:leucine--tRNA ligase-like n=1 Tax=Triplophysa rosa TaxID=992332 RepID=UPI0025460F52|nr:leucine--tRNA ligase-like [Triplophysa rosa]